MPTTLRDGLRVMIAEGSGFCDAVFFAHAYRATESSDEEALRTVAELAVAFAPSKERHLETTAQGRAFLDVTRAAWPSPPWIGCRHVGTVPRLSVAVRSQRAGHGIALAPAVHGYVHALAANLVSAGVRLDPARPVRRPARARRARAGGGRDRAARACRSLDDVAARPFRADLAGMQHETQYTRLFRS